MKILTVLVILAGYFPLFGQSVSKLQPPQLHVIFCTEQREVEFGRINMENDSLMNGFVETIHRVAKYPMRIRRLDPTHFTSRALHDTIAALKTSPQDVIILYYSGYGIAPANPAEKFANWRLDGKDKIGLSVNEVESWLKIKNVRLGLLIADCSTQRIDHESHRVEAMTDLSVDLSAQLIQKLFLRTKGIIKLGSSTPSTPGYINLVKWWISKYYPGTVFTNALCQTLNSLVTNTTPADLPYISIESLRSGTEYGIKRILADSPYKQIPVLEVKHWDGSLQVSQQASTRTILTGARWQGLNINEDDYGNLQQKWRPPSENRLPSQIDLSKYAPPVIDQGDKGICVAVSVGYYMRSILEAKRLGITDKNEILKHSYSPFYLYNKLKWYSDKECTFGIDAGTALDHIKQYGLPSFSAFPNPTSCEPYQPVQTDPLSRIEDYVKLFNITDPKDAKVLAAKQALSEGSPIVVGIETTGSMANLSFEKTLVPRLKSFVSELLDKEGSTDPMMAWEPYQANSLEFGHAMCVVGYDENMFGKGKGAFKLINSWGSSWGDKGYFWMSYDTFGKFAKYGYQALLSPTIKASDNLLDTDLKIMMGAFSTKRVAFTSTPNTSGLMTYKLTQPQRTGASFKFKIDVKKQTYLYLITASESDSAVTKLLPLPGYKMIVNPGNRLIYPSADMNLQLSGNAGQEYWLFLFSATPLEIDHYVQLLNSPVNPSSRFRNRAMTTGATVQSSPTTEPHAQKSNVPQSPFPDRIAKVFREKMVPTELIRYKRKKMGFFVQNDPKAHGQVVPLLVTMSHVP